MKLDVTVNGFAIVSDGEPSVGISRGSWDLKGPFYFSDQEELELFRQKLKEAFEYVADDCYVETFEEIEERERKINEAMDPSLRGKELLEMLANATVTHYQCGGHNKAFWNESRAKSYKEELKELGVDIPTDQELLKTGTFNGKGSY